MVQLAKRRRTSATATTERATWMVTAFAPTAIATATVYPGADEICDGFDSNCSGAIPLNEFDRDGDLVIDCLAEEPSGDCSSAGDSAASAWLALIGLVGLFALRRRSV